MSEILIEGGVGLEGEVCVQGAKNSVLPILAATILTGGQVLLEGCPHLRDVDASVDILRALGCRARWEGDALSVDTAPMNGCAISDALMRRMRSSAIFLGAVLARCGRAEMSYPGGCELGPRPIDLHLAGLRDLGARIREEGGFLHCTAAHLTGKEIVLALPSVGATENLMLAACGAEGVTVISNAAREPEIVDLQEFLNACGADVAGAGSSTVVVRGTALAERYADGSYRPQTLEEATALGAKILELFLRSDIPVPRIGLQPSEELAQSVVAGPYHPALGELVKSRVYRNRAQALLETVPPGSNVVLAVAPNRVSLMTGQKRCNVHWLRQRYGLNSLRIVPEPMEDWEIRLQSSESLDKINR